MKCEINHMTHTTEKVYTKNVPEGPKMQYHHRLEASLPCHRLKVFVILRTIVVHNKLV